MNHLTRSDYARALVVLGQLEAACVDLPSFVQAAVQALSELVPCELATLSVTSLEQAEHVQPNAVVVRLETHAVGANHRVVVVDRTVAIPLFVGQGAMVSVVLSRRGTDFAPRDCERLELLRPHLAFLYRKAGRARGGDWREQGELEAPMSAVEPQLPSTLTAREADVMRWLTAGKTDAEIGALLSISVRTVQKHLEHVYVKLGVETRTAAVMRALGNGPGRRPDAAPNL